MEDDGLCRIRDTPPFFSLVCFELVSLSLTNPPPVFPLLRPAKQAPSRRDRRARQGLAPGRPRLFTSPKPEASSLKPQDEPTPTARSENTHSRTQHRRHTSAQALWGGRSRGVFPRPLPHGSARFFASLMCFSTLSGLSTRASCSAARWSGFRFWLFFNDAMPVSVCSRCMHAPVYSHLSATPSWSRSATTTISHEQAHQSITLSYPFLQNTGKKKK